MPDIPKKRQNLNPLNSFSQQVRKGVQKGRKIGSSTIQKLPVAGKWRVKEGESQKREITQKSADRVQIKTQNWIKVILSSEMRYHLPIFALIVLGFGILAYADKPDLILFLSFGFTCGYTIIGILALSNRLFQDYLSGFNGAVIGVGLTIVATVVAYMRIDIDGLWFFSIGLFLLWTLLQAHFFAVLTLGISSKVVKYVSKQNFLMVLLSLLFSLMPFLIISFLVFVGIEKASEENEAQWIIFLAIGLLSGIIFVIRNLWILGKSKESKQLWFRVFFFYGIFLSYLFYRGFSLISNYQEIPPFPEGRWLDLIIMFLTSIVAAKAFSEKSVQITAGSFDLPPTSAAFFGFALTSTYAAGQFWLFTEWKGDITQISILTNALFLISGLIVFIFLFRRFSVHEREIWKHQEKRIKASKKLQIQSQSIQKRMKKWKLKGLEKDNNVKEEKK